jgi:thiol-disulfide isomerase/thioredoxin
MADKEAMSDEAMTDKEDMSDEAMHDDEMMADEEMSDEAVKDDEMMAMELPAWFETELTNVNTGQTFKITDFQDKVVLVETLAVWCSNCLRQQREVQALHDLLGDQANLVSVALDIDPNETNDILKAHTDKNEFDWVYAVAPPEVAREIGQLYGGQFLNPPATPMLIIDQHGQAHPLPFGHKTAQSLQEALAPFLNDIEG